MLPEAPTALKDCLPLRPAHGKLYLERIHLLLAVLHWCAVMELMPWERHAHGQLYPERTHLLLAVLHWCAVMELIPWEVHRMTG